MAAPPSTPGVPIESKQALIDFLESGCKPTADWRIGTEHEKFVFQDGTFLPAPYEGEWGIRALLEGLQGFGWDAILENGNPVALSHKNGCSITLEPGGQVELAGAPLENIHQTCNEVHSHLKQVKEVAEDLGVGLIGIGFNPKWKRDDIPWMPKGRYKIMRDYMPKVGSLGLDMMVRTSTVQVNLDFKSEADMVKKFRVSLALQPIATAMFADSPFVEGKPSGYLSYRSHIWEDTDPDRCGILPFVFEDGMGFERYVDYILDVPMYFVYRDGNYLDAAGQSFRDFLDGSLPVLPGEIPTTGDWGDHLTTVFPEVRLKKFIEMRGADGGPWRRLCALPALWTGLLYDQTSLDAAWDLVKDWTSEEHEGLRREVPIHALNTPFRNGKVQQIAGETLEIASSGLRRRNRLDAVGTDETGFLGTLYEIVDSGRTAAEEKLEKYHSVWNGNIDSIFEEYAY
ncbi:MAG: glutamate--cysteine ligase [Rhodospirillaceae bacterium]|nr:glutamate--cysteine ligase [Rhodospirillaceae bacterium]|tara:strand:+ start:6341 stop:7708 length:1368 start_codon:yes stop_codon:yes gene_type:complete